ncbi:TetR/AcrR family transcriptional regulator [Siminovitchia sediminis]|uniref:TetR/AcrR family transcriptional regulator n=1 Tax=Siminovitchia sediminis TaxID=1274353 RepID=A0ABW4KJB5_9BACI
MTKDRIKEVALVQFAEAGFEGTSLSNIASEVGIKKPSIYAHFKGKDDLFLSLFEDVCKYELDFVSSFLEENKNNPLEECLFELLSRYSIRCVNDDNTRFWIHQSFFPPPHLREIIMSDLYKSLDGIESNLIPIFEKAIVSGEIQEISPDTAANGYLGILDSLFVESLYGGHTRSKRMLESSWFIYWRGLSK